MSSSSERSRILSAGRHAGSPALIAAGLCIAAGSAQAAYVAAPEHTASFISKSAAVDLLQGVPGAAGSSFLAAEDESNVAADPGATQPVVAAPIPEPETYALMLAGLGALGWISRRRRRA